MGFTGVKRSTGPVAEVDLQAGGARPVTERSRRMRAGSEPLGVEARAREKRSLEQRQDFFASGVNSDTVQRSLKWIKPDKYASPTPTESYISHLETVVAISYDRLVAKLVGI